MSWSGKVSRSRSCRRSAFGSSAGLSSSCATPSCCKRGTPWSKRRSWLAAIRDTKSSSGQRVSSEVATGTWIRELDTACADSRARSWSSNLLLNVVDKVTCCWASQTTSSSSGVLSTGVGAWCNNATRRTREAPLETSCGWSRKCEPHHVWHKLWSVKGKQASMALAAWTTVALPMGAGNAAAQRTNWPGWFCTCEAERITDLRWFAGCWTKSRCGWAGWPVNAGGVGRTT